MRHAVGALTVAIALANGCGRHGFDAPIDSASGSGGDGAFDAARDGDGSILADAAPDAMTDAPLACINDLSDVGTANFEITFTLQATATGKSALVHQRDPCTAATYWDVYLDVTSRVVFELKAGGSMASSPSLVTVTDGMPHQIRCTRVGASVSISVDGGASNTQSGSTYNFDSLPAMEIAAGHPCAGFAPLATGTVTNVCVRLL